ncbi:MAG: hypothetical protein HFF67_08840 [Oscillospiraceae bacterium]|nr:hypothetical protein [Oscillospiraceae bacterium]
MKEKVSKRTLLLVTGPQCRSIAAPKSRIARPAGQKVSKRTLYAKLRFAYLAVLTTPAGLVEKSGGGSEHRFGAHLSEKTLAIPVVMG